MCVEFVQCVVYDVVCRFKNTFIESEEKKNENGKLPLLENRVVKAFVRSFLYKSVPWRSRLAL